MTDLSIHLSTLVYKPSVIVVTEVNSKTHNVSTADEFQLDGYYAYSCNVGVDHLRGILVYIDSDLKHSPFKLDSNFSECLFVKITGVLDKNLIIGAFYRSPRSDSVNNLVLLDIFNQLSKIKGYN